MYYSWNTVTVYVLGFVFRDGVSLEEITRASSYSAEKWQVMFSLDGPESLLNKQSSCRLFETLWR